jgi:hypothetical protein
VIGAVSTMGTMRRQEALAISFAAAVLGATLGCAWSKELSVGHPVLEGAGLFAFPALVMPGLDHLLGPWAWVVAGGLVVTSPAVGGLVARGLHRTARRLDLSDIELAALADEDDALRRQWLGSTALLETALTDEDRLVAVEVRGQILDALAKRWGDHLPGYVWASVHGRFDDGGPKPGAEQER